MKVRESEMPELAQWESYFDPPLVIEKLGLGHQTGDIVEFGCGYGTFTIPLAAVTNGTVHAIDVDQAMLDTTARRAAQLGLGNIVFVETDFMRDGCGLADGAAVAVVLFNILHAENPVALLGEARRAVAPGGRIAAIHWNYDPETPRGPPMSIRPLPEDYPRWAEAAGLECGPLIDLPPHHYGYVFRHPLSGG